ncbi:hypothetical protein L227DRAFT_575814 [Lentinus tigrinus ALCF2SS1-6]|uniref:lytic cellulose monooxygenase (C4-dehydrogenating) n=1 Tax=Lentinus tigrinus ALCF2SS1-6 TaxID=1328759 RepID=A0A5C2S7G5_9APHY|nr:hypothetical protein L227DRAFT_575814 [Lentinus tigrinus ALCF2SS1-6]
MMFSPISLAVLAAALLAPSAVNAHGYVQDLTVGGKSYSGWLPFTDPYESPVPKRIVRKLPDDGPVLDETSSDLACNKGGESGAGAVATAAAGSEVVFHWTNWPSDHQGPVSTYMTSCDGDCKTFDASNAKWFKVDAAGYSNGKWAATQLIENGMKWTSTIPKELKAGQYLIRNEIVALHSVGQPQYYPSCAQIEVTGGGSTVPSGSELVSIPGLYNNVKFPDIWDDNFKSFTIPGPAPIGDSSSGSGNSDPASSSVEASSTKASSANHASSTHASSTAASRSASSTHVSTTAAHTSAESAPTSSVATSSAPASTGRCKAKRSRRGMVKRHVSHHAKRHH